MAVGAISRIMSIRGSGHSRRRPSAGRAENNLGRSLYFTRKTRERETGEGYAECTGASVPQLSTVSIEHRGRGDARRVTDCKTRRSKRCAAIVVAIRRRGRDIRGSTGIRRNPADPRCDVQIIIILASEMKRYISIYLSGRPSIAILYSRQFSLLAEAIYKICLDRLNLVKTPINNDILSVESKVVSESSASIRGWKFDYLDVESHVNSKKISSPDFNYQDGSDY